MEIRAFGQGGRWRDVQRGATTATPSEVLWVHVPAASDANHDEVAAEIDRLGRTPPVGLNRLFDDDNYPGLKTDETDPNRSVVAFEAIAADKHTIELRPVEFLQSEAILVSRTQPSITLHATSPEGREGDRIEPKDMVRGALDRWGRYGPSTSGDLGIVAMYTLIKSFTDARRKLHEWIDQAEVTFLVERTHDKPGEADAFQDIRSLISQFGRRVRALKVPAEREFESWFTGVSDTERGKDADRKLDRALEDLHRMSDQLRSSLELVLLHAVQRQERESERINTRIEAIAAVLLFPALVAGVFGANTALPGGGHWTGFALMAALMVVGGCTTFVALRRLRRPAGATVRGIEAIVEVVMSRFRKKSGRTSDSSQG